MSQETNSAPVTENKMGTMPIGRLVFNMSLPMMISMLVQALYNIVDSIFVAKLSENALTAVSLAFPLQTLIIAVATGTGVGVNALLSKSLGAHKYDEARQNRHQRCRAICIQLRNISDSRTYNRKAFLHESDWKC